MTEAEKRTIILDYVKNNPKPDQNLVQQIIIPIFGNSKKYGGAYTKYYLTHNGMQYFNNVPKEEINSSTVYASKVKTNSYDQHLIMLYVKHIPEYGMCEISRIKTLGKVPNRKVLLDIREAEFSHRMFIFKDDNLAFNECGTNLSVNKQCRYYNKDVMSIMNYTIRYEYQDFNVCCSENFYAVQQFVEFISTCSNPPDFALHRYRLDDLYMLYKNHCFPRKITKRKPINLSCPYLTPDNESKLTDISILNEKYPILVKKKQYTYSYSTTPRIKADFSVGKGMIKTHNGINYVDKITDNLICFRMFKKEYEYPENTMVFKDMAIEESKIFANNLKEYSRIYFDAEKNEVHRYTKNYYGLGDFKADRAKDVYTDCPIINLSTLYSSKVVPDKFDEIFKYYTTLKGSSLSEITKLRILITVIKHPEALELYNNGYKDIAISIITGEELYSICGAPKTSSKKVERIIDAPKDFLDMINYLIGKSRSCYGSSDTMRMLRYVFCDGNKLFDLSDDQIKTIKQNILKVFNTYGQIVRAFVATASRFYSSYSIYSYINGNENNIKKLLLAKTPEEIKSADLIINNILSLYEIDDEERIKINPYESNQDVLSQYIIDYTKDNTVKLSDYVKPDGIILKI